MQDSLEAYGSMPLNFEVKSVIENKIAEIEREYQQTQGLILTEDDLKCLIYNKLSQIPELWQRIETKDKHVFAKSVHSEVSWFDKNDKLTILPDISILEPEHLSILKRNESRLPLPNKQFIVGGKAIIFELKFIRNKTGITKKTLEGPVMKDYKKIERLFDKLVSQKAENDMFCFFVIFNKTNIKCREFENFLEKNGQTDRHKIIYATGNVTFGEGQMSRF